MKTQVICAAAACAMAAGLAHAQGPMTYQPSPYIGGDALFWELDPEGGGGDFDSTGLRLRAGVAFNDYFALEGHLGTGGSDSGLDLDYLAGGFAKGMLPITPQFTLYGLLGATEVEFDGADSESDVSYGGGGSYALMPNLSLDADYVRYLEESSYDFDAVSLGATFHF
ncbi:outer membrane beta-barrel protein [Halomonas koreensis]|uniref:Outer membrane beta-barrel protein n=1 Tax=Halomonas koreensis TaxID=245385 RepID=A0ABU1G3I9_9GAMM|nr:outer membrane beta-barrel protein [Halomonas koreensis]MDR5867502.1 outer membrane beta-barrel protein [Halomonas koreensis]